MKDCAGKSAWWSGIFMLNKQDFGSRPRDHMANERTFLAWIRTSLGIMVFGFVVEKFSIFMKHIIPYFQEANLPVPSKYSSYFGVILVLFGALLCLLAFIKFRKVEKQIETNCYQPSMLLNIMVTLAVLLIGIFLMIYLVHGLKT